MRPFLVLFLGLLLGISVVNIPSVRAEQIADATAGFSQISSGAVRYTSPKTARSYTLTQPASALKTLRSLAIVVNKQEGDAMKKTKTTNRNRAAVFMITGDTKKVWYFAEPGSPLYYFDGTPASFALLRQHLSEQVSVTAPSPTYPAFTYQKQGDDQVVVMDVAKGVKMDVLTGHDSIRPTEECRYPKYCKAEAQAEPFSSYLKRSDQAPLVINGGYFDAYSQPLNEQNFHTVSSDLVINGEMKSMYGWDKAWGDGGMIAQKKDGTFTFYYPIRNWLPDADQIQTAVSNYPLVLLNGVPRTKEQMPVSDPNDYKFWLKARRGGLGLSADGAKVIYVSTIGTVEDLGKALLKAGSVNGFALDAGGSNGFAYGGKTIYTPGRKLASVILFK